jgi:hypothetical protein
MCKSAKKSKVIYAHSGYFRTFRTPYVNIIKVINLQQFMGINLNEYL